LVSFGDLERVVCSSIGHLRPRIREPEGGSAPASVSEFAKRFNECPGFRGISRRNFGKRLWVSKNLGIQESPESPGIPSGKEFVSFGDLERGVCSSIDYPDRGFESLKVARLLPR